MPRSTSVNDGRSSAKPTEANAPKRGRGQSDDSSARKKIKSAVAPEVASDKPEKPSFKHVRA